MLCQDSLTQLDLSWNHLTGTLPPGLKQCKSLEYLMLAHNELRGNLTSAALEPLTELSTLDLSGNHLSGPLPALSKNSNLRRLKLSNNDFTGELSGLGGDGLEA